MKTVLTLLLISLSIRCATAARMVSYRIKTEFGRCTGSTPCRACSNCSACKYCSGGGSCGVCASRTSRNNLYKQSAPSQLPAPKSSIGGQCQAITKKGSRCSRISRSNGYCWQHGG